MMEIRIISDETNITLKDLLLKTISKRQYKSFRHLNAQFYINDVLAKTYDIVKLNDEVKVLYNNLDKTLDWKLYGCNTEIIYEDENYIVCNKKDNLLSIPTKACPYSLYQEIMYHLNNTTNTINNNVSIINRLDKETSGLCLIAKNRLAASLMSNTHLNMIRKYKCLCHGVYLNDEGRIENYLEKEETSNKRYISDTGKLAISDYKVLNRLKDKTLVEYTLKTGRTHQIRVHTLSLGHPILGDKIYGNDKYNRLYLQSYYLEYIDPFTKENKVFEIKGWWEE